MASYQHISHGFDPVFDEHSRVLVLGSFPSVLSRANAFYYGNPQNRFWRVIAHSLGKPVPPNEGEPLPPNGSTASLEESIAAKKALLLEGGIALWDAIEECDIKGSSDASIKNVVPAHIERITECAHIEAVICNGATAGRLYKRYLQWKVGLVAHVLPSTSPANAAWKTERLIERWGNELRAIADELAEVDRQRETAADPQERGSFLRHHTNRRTCRLELRGAQVDAGKQARQHQARTFDARAAARGGTWRIPSAVEGRRAPRYRLARQESLRVRKRMLLAPMPALQTFDP